MVLRGLLDLFIYEQIYNPHISQMLAQGFVQYYNPRFCGTSALSCTRETTSLDSA